MVRCAIWYHLYNLKNVENTHGGVLILVKLQAFATIPKKHNICNKRALSPLPLDEAPPTFLTHAL